MCMCVEYVLASNDLIRVLTTFVFLHIKPVVPNASNDLIRVLALVCIGLCNWTRETPETLSNAEINRARKRPEGLV